MFSVQSSGLGPHIPEAPLRPPRTGERRPKQSSGTSFAIPSPARSAAGIVNAPPFPNRRLAVSSSEYVPRSNQSRPDFPACSRSQAPAWDGTHPKLRFGRRAQENEDRSGASGTSFAIPSHARSAAGIVNAPPFPNRRLAVGSSESVSRPINPVPTFGLRVGKLPLPGGTGGVSASVLVRIQSPPADEPPVPPSNRRSGRAPRSGAAATSTRRPRVLNHTRLRIHLGTKLRLGTALTRSSASAVAHRRTKTEAELRGCVFPSRSLGTRRDSRFRTPCRSPTQASAAIRFISVPSSGLGPHSPEAPLRPPRTGERRRKRSFGGVCSHAGAWEQGDSRFRTPCRPPRRSPTPRSAAIRWRGPIRWPAAIH